MSWAKFARVIAIYFGCAIIFGIIRQQLEPFPLWGAAGIGNVVGAAFALFLMSGIIPVCAVWAFGRFRLLYASHVLVTWATLGLVFAGLAYYGKSYEINHTIEKTKRSVDTLQGKDYDNFVRSTKLSCADTQRKTQFNPQVGVSEQPISRFCACFAEQVAEEMTVAEYRFFANHRTVLESLQEKLDRVSSICGRVALAR